jgi:hypothetical protein
VVVQGQQQQVVQLALDTLGQSLETPIPLAVPAQAANFLDPQHLLIVDQVVVAGLETMAHQAVVRLAQTELMEQLF